MDPRGRLPVIAAPRIALTHRPSGQGFQHLL